MFMLLSNNLKTDIKLNVYLKLENLSYHLLSHLKLDSCVPHFKSERKQKNISGFLCLFSGFWPLRVHFLLVLWPFRAGLKS